MKNWSLDVRSDLHEAGRNEDGEAIIEEVFYLIATNDYGTRYRSDATADAPQPLWDRAAALGADFDPTRTEGWFETDPCYGSRAYEAEEPAIAAREREDELHARWLRGY